MCEGAAATTNSPEREQYIQFLVENCDVISKLPDTVTPEIAFLFPTFKVDKMIANLAAAGQPKRVCIELEVGVCVCVCVWREGERVGERERAN